MEYSIELIIVGFAMLAVGAVGIAAYARYERRPHEVDTEDFLGIGLISVLLTGFNGGGIIAIVNGAFAFDLAARLGLIASAVAAAAIFISVFWRLFGVHRMVYVVQTRNVQVSAINDRHINQNRDRVNAA